MARAPRPRVKRAAKARACRSKYIGQTVRVRGREATVEACARPRVRPAPKSPVPRLRVRYARSGRVRPVPRATIYRAARCAARPEARGCRGFDPERAPWLSRRPADTSFDFGALEPGYEPPAPTSPARELPALPAPAEAPPAPAPARRARGGRVPEAPAPRWRPRVPEKQAPVRLPASPLYARMQPETRDLAPWLAYAAPWLWTSVAKTLADGFVVNVLTGDPLSYEERGKVYGWDWRGRYGAESRTPNDPPRGFVESSGAYAPFVPRASIRGFIADAGVVANAILRVESGLWSGEFWRDPETGALALAPQTPPEKVHIPHGTHPSTAGAMRRRQGEANFRASQHFSSTVAELAKARAIVAAWASGARPIPSGMAAFARAENSYQRDDGTVFAETWEHQGRDWRLTIADESGAVRLEQWTANAGWRFRWGTKFDFARDRIPTEDAPAWVRAALRPLFAYHDYTLKSLFGGGFEGRRKSALEKYDKGRAEADPFAADCTSPSEAVRDAWELTRRIPCATRDARDLLVKARDSELFRLCNDDPHGSACREFYERVEGGCDPACTPRQSADRWGPTVGHDDGACPKQITAEQIARWSRGEEPVPTYVTDSDKPHRVGSTDNCYFSASMRRRRNLRDRALASIEVPSEVARFGDAAVDKYVEDTIRAQELATPEGPAWHANDARILGRVRAPYKMGLNELEDLKYAYREWRTGNMGPAYQLVARNTLRADADGEVSEQGLVEAVLEGWVEDQQQKNERGKDSRIKAFRARVKRDGAFTVAAELAEGTSGRSGRTGRGKAEDSP